VQDQRSRNAAVTESIETSVAEARFDERRRAVLAVLGFDPESSEVTKGHEPMEGIPGLFARLLEIPDRTVLEVLAIVMAETLASGTCLIESIGLHIGVDMADYWVADDAFYGLICDREVLTAILREVGGDAVAQAHVAEKGKTIKSVINDFLTGENGRTKREHWVPRWMAFPPTAYTERGGVAMVAAANRIRWQAEAEEPTDPAPQAPAMLPEPGNDAANERGVRPTRREFIMANIGTFKKSGENGYTGEIVTMSLQKKNVTIVAEEASENENAPSHRVFVAKIDIGAAWQKSSKEGRDYLSIKLDDPSFNAPIFASLFADEDGKTFNLIWSRARASNGN
jgi:uncharacterized protein (DUF736 family)